MVSYSYSWSGTSPVGTVSVQVSDDFGLLSNGQPDPNKPGTWNTLPLSLTPAVTGNTGNGGIDVLSTSWYAIRTVYTATSGTGTIVATVTAKVA